MRFMDGSSYFGHCHCYVYGRPLFFTPYKLFFLLCLKRIVGNIRFCFFLHYFDRPSFAIYCRSIKWVFFINRPDAGAVDNGINRIRPDRTKRLCRFTEIAYGYFFIAVWSTFQDLKPLKTVRAFEALRERFTTYTL